MEHGARRLTVPPLMILRRFAPGPRSGPGCLWRITAYDKAEQHPKLFYHRPYRPRQVRSPQSLTALREPFDGISSGGMNPPCGKVLAGAKTLGRASARDSADLPKEVFTEYDKTEQHPKFQYHCPHRPRRRKVRCFCFRLMAKTSAAPLRLLSPRSPRGGLRGGPVLILKYAPFAAPHPVGPRIDLPYGGMRID